MAILDLLVYPDPRLQRVSEPVEAIDDSLRAFIADLEETMRETPDSAGIAAPQVNRFARIALVDVSYKPHVPGHGRLVLINPEITEREGRVVGKEGCLSVPDYIGNVERSKRITLKALDEWGRENVYRMTGFEARAAQHEIDHLDGVLFLGRLVSRRDSLFRRKTGPVVAESETPLA